MHIKADGMTQFDIFHTTKSSELSAMLLKAAEICNFLKNAFVWAA